MRGQVLGLIVVRHTEDVTKASFLCLGKMQVRSIPKGPWDRVGGGGHGLGGVRPQGCVICRGTLIGIRKLPCRLGIGAGSNQEAKGRVMTVCTKRRNLQVVRIQHTGDGAVRSFRTLRV